MHVAGESLGSSPQPGHDLVGAVYDSVVDVVGVGAAAPAILLGGELRLDVALGGVVGEDCLADRQKVLGVDVKPMEVAVEHGGRLAVRLKFHPLKDGP